MNEYRSEAIRKRPKKDRIPDFTKFGKEKKYVTSI